MKFLLTILRSYVIIGCIVGIFLGFLVAGVAGNVFSPLLYKYAPDQRTRNQWEEILLIGTIVTVAVSGAAAGMFLEAWVSKERGRVEKSSASDESPTTAP